MTCERAHMQNAIFFNDYHFLLLPTRSALPVFAHRRRQHVIPSVDFPTAIEKLLFFFYYRDEQFLGSSNINNDTVQRNDCKQCEASFPMTRRAASSPYFFHSTSLTICNRTVPRKTY